MIFKVVASFGEGDGVDKFFLTVNGREKRDMDEHGF